MTHSKECEHVMAECDFGEHAHRWLEKVLTRHYPKQIIQLVWAKDKAGLHDWDWFVPFFDHGYVPRKRSITVEFTEEFWEMYDLVGSFVEPYTIELFPLIEEMSGDTQRVEVAMARSKPNLKYLYKVWSDTEIQQTQDASVLPEIRTYNVETGNFDIT